MIVKMFIKKKKKKNDDCEDKKENFLLRFVVDIFGQEITIISFMELMFWAE